MEIPITDMAAMANGILRFVRFEAQGMGIGEVERRILSMVMVVGREALVKFVATKGTGHRGKETIDAKGNRCPYVRDRTCAYRSIFGTIPIRRAYYHATGSPGIFPLDGEFNLPERGYSYLVQEFSSVRLGSPSPRRVHIQRRNEHTWPFQPQIQVFACTDTPTLALSPDYRIRGHASEHR
jgi:hypothetical protein